jgi:small-conductance mechanosensitive channel
MPATANNAAAAAPAAHKPAIEFSKGSMQQVIDQSWDWFWSHWLQIAISAAVGAAIVLALLGLRLLGLRLCQKRDGWHTHWPVTIGRAVSKTSFWFMVLFAAKLVDGYAAPPATLAQTINVLFTIAAALQGALWVRELILGVVESRAGDDHGGLSSAIGIIRLLVTIVLFAIATVAILDNLGVNVTGLVAGLGIGGIAIGLAAKGIFDDLFSALSIIFDRPFQRGDSISWDKTSGTVEAIGLKTTRLRATTGEEVVISNTNLLNKELHNTTRLARRRIVTAIGIAYYTPAALCAEVPAILRKVVEAQDKCKLVRCGLIGFGDSSLNYELQFDVYSDLYDIVFQARHEVSLGIVRAFGDAHIDFAWPTQVTIAAGSDGRPVADAAAEPAAEVVPNAETVEGPPSPTSHEKAPD